MSRRPLPIDAEVLLEALVARDEGLLATYLDLVDGTWHRLVDPAVTGRDNEALLDRVDADPERFAEVPRYTRMFRLMTEFVDTVDDDQLARLLDTALSGREAFRSFEAVLAAWPSERGRWHAYREAALVAWGVAWLRGRGVEPRWDRASPAEEPPEIPLLLSVALQGGRLQLEDEAGAVSALVRMARQLCELRGEPFRARGLRAATRFARGGIELHRQGNVVWIERVSPG